ncbi:hypothetical protein DVH24_024653 [Malus domestica]|uniref:Uncharacterized protein n=1 Tax=Malus domestica TaxID=3750 RepID=A0A498JGJ2_MALDO|nr:hypothetical protein DVH24_024653 [Malus domestica]
MNLCLTFVSHVQTTVINFLSYFLQFRILLLYLGYPHSDLIISHMPTHPTKHSHIRYTHFMYILIFHSLTFRVIKHYRPLTTLRLVMGLGSVTKSSCGALLVASFIATLVVAGKTFVATAGARATLCVWRIGVRVLILGKLMKRV